MPLLSAPPGRLTLTLRLIHRLPRPRPRTFATHRDPYPTSPPPTPPPAPTPSLLSQLPPRGQSDGVGPFALRMDRSAKSEEESKSWAQLSAAGKVKRTTARTTNFGVILFGGALSAVIVYALATELFATNSPTVLYGDICDRMRTSPELTTVLQPPLIFHNTPPSPVAPRHRGRHVPSQLVVDSAGREHLIFRFWVEGKGSRPASSSSSSFSDTDEPFSDRMYTRAQAAAKQVRRAFAFLIGEPLPAAAPPAVRVREEAPREEEAKKGGWGFAGMFGGIRTTLGGGGKKKEEVVGEVEFEGEVHVDMVKDDRGNFVYRHLFVDVPNSRARKPRRIWVEGSSSDRQDRITWR